MDDFETLLFSIKWGRWVTIEYVIRPEEHNFSLPYEVPEPDFDSEDVLSTKVTLHEREYKRDNGDVYTILRTILAGIPGLKIISKYSRTRDLRRALESLKYYYQGCSYYNLLKSWANTIMNRKFFQDDKPKFRWEDFVW